MRVTSIPTKVVRKDLGRLGMHNGVAIKKFIVFLFIISGSISIAADQSNVEKEAKASIESKKELLESVGKYISIVGPIRAGKALYVDFKGIPIYIIVDARRESEAAKHQEISRSFLDRVVKLSGVLRHNLPMEEGVRLDPYVDWFHPEFYFEIADVSVRDQAESQKHE